MNKNFLTKNKNHFYILTNNQILAVLTVKAETQKANETCSFAVYN